MSLASLLAKAQETAKDSYVGEMHASFIVVPLSDSWDEKYKEETGQDWATWVTSNLGRGKVARLRGLYEAFHALRPLYSGGDLETRFHQDVIRRIAGATVPDNKRKECLEKVRDTTKNKGLAILCPNAAYAVIAEVCGKQSRPRVDQGERQLLCVLWHAAKAEIQRIGGVVPSVPEELSWID
jgi:hypothetical protein